MKLQRKLAAVAMSGLFTFAACSSDDDNATVPTSTIDRAAVITNYADLVLANYQVAMSDAVALEEALQAFTTMPTQESFDNAKDAWLQSRESYGTTEAFRFADGPIDSGDTEEIEGYLNSWPMDEAFVDYVAGDENAGIINNLTAYPVLSKDVLVSDNGNGGDENVTIGYHAIEFLLWGQDNTDPTENMAGLRPFTDFIDGGTAQNQDRRREYLLIVADLLTDHLQVMIDQWSGTYRATFLSLNEEEALSNMINSISELSRSELAIERMAVALENQDQEDEHSCFSDNTHRDIRLNLQGIANVYQGDFTGINGPSLQDLIAEADSDLGSELDTLLATAISETNATAIPFDLAIVDGESSAAGTQVQSAVIALVAFGDKLLEARTSLNL